MIVLLNGQFVPEADAVISAFDRGFLYGDGLFETVRVVQGKVFRWEQHMRRLFRGARFLHIRLPFSFDAARGWAEELIARNQLSEAVLRLTLSRGAGARGYSPRGAKRPTVLMSAQPVPPLDGVSPPRWRLVTSSFRLPAGESLARFKTCNKLPQVLARAEADAAGVDDALLLNSEGWVVEATSANLFWILNDTVFTPPLSSGVLPGVTRAVILELCRKLRLPLREAGITPRQLHRTEGVFLSLSTLGIAEAVSLDGRPLRQSLVTNQLRTAYAKLLLHESAAPPHDSRRRAD